MHHPSRSWYVALIFAKASMAGIGSFLGGRWSRASSTRLKLPSITSGGGSPVSFCSMSSQKVLLWLGSFGVYMVRIVIVVSLCQGIDTRRARPGIITFLFIPCVFIKVLLTTKATPFTFTWSRSINNIM